MSHDIVVVGASAGGVQALETLVRGLPADLKAAIFVVLHLPAWSDSKLPSILSRNGPLPAVAARDGQPIEPGHIYVAPPDVHLVLEPDHMQLWRGPKENFNRPSINPLFRSAAHNFDGRTVGVILSGSLDDGSAGLWMVKRCGGIAVVQDPADALSEDMPRNAMRYVTADYVAPAARIGLLLAQLASSEATFSERKKELAPWNNR